MTSFGLYRISDIPTDRFPATGLVVGPVVDSFEILLKVVKGIVLLLAFDSVVLSTLLLNWLVEMDNVVFSDVEVVLTEGKLVVIFDVAFDDFDVASDDVFVVVIVNAVIVAVIVEVVSDVCSFVVVIVLSVVLTND